MSTGLLIAGYIGEITWRDVILGTLGVFVAGATTQKFVKPPPEGG